MDQKVEIDMEEMLDTFDINGKFLGAKPRSFCHSENPGVYHKPVWIWIVSETGGGDSCSKTSFNKKEKSWQMGYAISRSCRCW